VLIKKIGGTILSSGHALPRDLLDRYDWSIVNLLYPLLYPLSAVFERFARGVVSGVNANA